MRTQRIAALLLAVALQVLPVCRLALVNQAVAPPGFAFVLRWLAVAVVSLGAVHAVSGASAAVAGVASYTNNAQAGPVSLTATGTVGVAFNYRIIVSNPGPDTGQDYFRAAPLPPGLTINTNLGGNGFITGTPAVAGTNLVTVVAGNALYTKGVASATITLAVQPQPPTAPKITRPPASQTVPAGTNVSFTVLVSGSSPFAFRWAFAGTNLAGATNQMLELVDVQPAQSGLYTVFVTNSAGATSATATLTVNAPLLLANPHWANGAFAFDVTGPAQTNYVILTSSNLANWTPVQTNFTADGLLHFTNSTPTLSPAFYEATLGP